MANVIQCQDECAFEYAPAFLIRTYQDCKSDGLDVSKFALRVCVKRNAMSHSQYGDMNTAIASMNEQLESSYGLWILKDVQLAVAATRAEAFSDLLECAMSSLADNIGEGARQDISGYCKAMKQLSAEPSLRNAFDSVLLLLACARQSSDATEEDIDASITNLSSSEENDTRPPECFRKLFRTGPGKQLISDAR